MNSLAISDSLLFLVATYFALQSKIPIAFRLGAAVLGAAAILGVLRFSELLPLPQLHSFFSALGASSAFLLIGVSVIWPARLVSVKAKYASILLIASAALGLIMVTGFGFAIFGQLIALLSVLLIVVSALRNRRIYSLFGALALALASGFVLFVMKYSVSGYLQPGDFLHIFTAIGLLTFGQIHSAYAHLITPSGIFPKEQIR
jgi:hypothetical protein